MKFVMVMILCFGVDCDAIFDTTAYESYEDCYSVARQTVTYMQQLYPDSSGEIHCYNEQQIADFQKYLDEGNKPVLTNPDPLPSAIDA
jgi:hypothetical protein|tara:strand:+ start:846 stop:1109 length:264 start_codon:yes stop_codon:yes gene_type:complete